MHKPATIKLDSCSHNQATSKNIIDRNLHDANPIDPVPSSHPSKKAPTRGPKVGIAPSQIDPLELGISIPLCWVPVVQSMLFCETTMYPTAIEQGLTRGMCAM